ncbi:DNA-binding domain-containing protein [Szabonella alba]|uniref:Putative DNA-binding domain-containing protein n=1 Tax=Szabonella alba TaxID=2804194 RepID=A0A8K0Y0K4_9RHOB|nr:DNA-binding domain-containing protein [Szabonella alba]MBL4916937.1 putative DNA-binding domain-containing protein [Szabonella alba]
MPAHPDFIARFEAGLRGGDLPPGLTARDPAEVERRFAVYRNNQAVGLSQALALRFPVIRRLVGEDFFAALARAYAGVERPVSPVLAEWGAGFSEFLDRFPPLAAYPYMGDVARIEYARGRAFHAADAAPVDPAVFAMADPGRLRLGLHPSVTLLSLAHPAVSIWQRNQPGAGAKGALPAGPETALILRDTTFDVPVRALDVGEAALIGALLEGATLAGAAEQAQAALSDHNPQPLLVALLRAGAITHAEE